MYTTHIFKFFSKTKSYCFHGLKNVRSRSMSSFSFSHKKSRQYSDAIRDLNALQSNQLTIKLAAQNDPKEKMARFSKQIELAGLNLSDLNRLNVVHVGGTKGKGSTCVFVDSIIRRNGLKTGFYNSPHLISVSERILINGEPLNHEKFTDYFYEIYDKLIENCDKSRIPMPTYFSFLTIMAFHIFLTEKVDCSIIEVGIGGEYDPTNVIEKPIVCGITTLDYDHTNLLGNTIESIADTKAGICKPGVPLFTVNQASYKEALDVIRQRAIKTGSPFHICQPLKNVAHNQLGIKGSAQLTNAALACHLSGYFLSKLNHDTMTNVNGDSQDESSRLRQSELCDDFDTLPKSFQHGLTNCTWNGRCQTIRISGRVVMYLDGAHTRESMINCLEWFKESSSDDADNACKILLVNIVGDRDRKDILSPLANYKSFSYVIFSSNILDMRPESNSVRIDTYAADKRDTMIQNMQLNSEAWNTISEMGSLGQNSRCLMIPTIRESLDFLNELFENESNKMFEVLVTGSLHFVGTVLKGLDFKMNKPE